METERIVGFMSHHHHTIERQCDVAIVGGSAAGLAAALQMGRQRRSVIVIDAGEPRNAPAAHMHSYLGHEGLPPAEFLSIARAEARSYGAEILAGRVANCSRDDDQSFRLELDGGHVTVSARRVLAATGLVDELPEIEGLVEHWGRQVIHCPFCHGYEVRDQRIVQIITHPMSLHSAPLFGQLASQLTLVLHDGVDLSDPQLQQFRDAGVSIVGQRAKRVVSDGQQNLEAVELEDGRVLEADAVAVTGRFSIRAEPFASLGVATVAHPSGLGDTMQIDASGETSVAGLYAAGNVTDPVQQVLLAAAQGSSVAGAICLSLAQEDLDRASRSSGNQAEWDRRYGGEQVWSGNPNGALVQEAVSLVPGTVLDVGAGEGGDAVWLAEQGWAVTATDISERGLHRIGEVAAERSLPIDLLHADANTRDAFGPAVFDLVTIHYPAIPRTPDLQAVHNVLNAVAPDGTLLVVGHAPAHAPGADDGRPADRPFDGGAYVQIAHFVEAVSATEGWDITTHETRPRPPGSATGSHHVDDVVLRVQRLPIE